MQDLWKVFVDQVAYVLILTSVEMEDAGKCLYMFHLFDKNKCKDYY
jgi:hypothetical protein